MYGHTYMVIDVCLMYMYWLSMYDGEVHVCMVIWVCMFDTCMVV